MLRKFCVHVVEKRGPRRRGGGFCDGERGVELGAELVFQCPTGSGIQRAL